MVPCIIVLKFLSSFGPFSRSIDVRSTGYPDVLSVATLLLRNRLILRIPALMPLMRHVCRFIPLIGDAKIYDKFKTLCTWRNAVKPTVMIMETREAESRTERL